MAHEIKIKEIINGVQITETIDENVVEKLISYQSKPFLRTTNETGEETYQVLDIVGEIYNTPALATDFRIIDANDSVFIPADGLELIAYSYKIRAFRADNEDDESHTGFITTTSNSLTINLPSDNVNWAKIGGSFYEKYYPDTFNFTPVTTGQKILIVYAKPDAQVFHLAQGAEGTEAVEPPYSGLFVARIIVDTEGVQVDVAIAGYKEREEDGWNHITLQNALTLLPYAYDLRSSYWVEGSVANAIIGGIQSGVVERNASPIWDGKEFWIYNNTGQDLTLDSSAVTEEAYLFSGNNTPLNLKDKQSCKLKWHTSKEGTYLEIIGVMSGGADFPEGNTGDVLVKSATEWQASNRLTTAETKINEIQISQVEITTSTSITNLTTSTGTLSGKVQHQRTVLVKNGVNAINITLESTAYAKFEAIYIKKGSASITFVAGSGVTLNKIANDGILNGIAGSGALVQRDGSVYNIYISNY